MSGVSGIVKAVIGQVFAVSPDGSKRLLTEGDRILGGEQVQTGPTGAISLSLADGKQVVLGRDSHWDSSGHVATDATAAQQQDNRGYSAGHCRRAGPDANPGGASRRPSAWQLWR